MGVAKFNNKPVQSVEDMLRIAKRVNAKLRNSLVEIEKEIALAINVAEGRVRGWKIHYFFQCNPFHVSLSTDEQKHTDLEPTAISSAANGSEAHGARPANPSVVQTQATRQSTTSTITSDYFSMNSKQAIDKSSTSLGGGDTSLKHCQSFEDQATQTDDEEITERRPIRYYDERGRKKRLSLDFGLQKKVSHFQTNLLIADRMRNLINIDQALDGHQSSLERCSLQEIICLARCSPSSNGSSKTRRPRQNQ